MHNFLTLVSAFALCSNLVGAEPPSTQQPRAIVPNAVSKKFCGPEEDVYFIERSNPNPWEILRHTLENDKLQYEMCDPNCHPLVVDSRGQNFSPLRQQVYGLAALHFTQSLTLFSTMGAMGAAMGAASGVPTVIKIITPKTAGIIVTSAGMQVVSEALHKVGVAQVADHLDPIAHFSKSWALYTSLSTPDNNRCTIEVDSLTNFNDQLTTMLTVLRDMPPISDELLNLYKDKKTFGEKIRALGDYLQSTGIPF
jgi:hypothetical protein